MNPVFWFLVIVALIGAWFALTPLFKKIGDMITGATDNAVKQMFDDEDEKE